MKVEAIAREKARLTRPAIFRAMEMKILAVDDDNLLLELLVMTLSSFGYSQVLTAQSGSQALNLIDALDGSDAEEGEGMFGCILLDIQMPNMDGIELCSRLRSMPAYSRTPIIMITAMSDKSFMDRAFKAGATDYVTKPFDALELESRIRLANILANEQRKALENFFAVSTATSVNDPTNRIGFDEAITIEGVSNIIDCLAMENYLIQLSKQRVFDCLAVGFKFIEAEQAFDTLRADEFYQLLAEIAGGLAYSLRGTDCMISYFGCGIFVCILDKANAGGLGRAESYLPQAIRDLELEIDGRPPTIGMARPTGGSLSSSQNIHSLLVEAIDSASKLGGSRALFGKSPRRARIKALKYNILG